MEYTKRWKKNSKNTIFADRNILANQALNSFSAFDENALVRITPQDVRDKGHVPTNSSVFLQSFKVMSGPEKEPYLVNIQLTSLI